MSEDSTTRIKEEHEAIMRALMDAVRKAQQTGAPAKVAFIFAGMEVWVRP